MRAATLALCAIVFPSARLCGQISNSERWNFKKPDSIAGLYPKYSLQNLRILTDKLTKPLSTEEEKFRAIYVWICNNIANDYPLYLENKRHREKVRTPEDLQAWYKEFNVRVFKTLLNDQKTVCSGYAYLVREMASLAGLSCVIVDGYGRTARTNVGEPGFANHSWNVVKLNGKWYLCDATWSSGSFDPATLRFVKKFNASYFLAEPSLFVRNHYPMDSSWMLLHDKPTLKEFLNRPLVYSGAYTYGITQLVPETFVIDAEKGKTVSFRFSRNDKTIEKTELRVEGPDAVYSVYPQLHPDPGLYRVDYVFTESGTHLVHVLLNGNFVFTYSVNVR